MNNKVFCFVERRERDGCVLCEEDEKQKKKGKFCWLLSVPLFTNNTTQHFHDNQIKWDETLKLWLLETLRTLPLCFLFDELELCRSQRNTISHICRKWKRTHNSSINFETLIIFMNQKYFFWEFCVCGNLPKRMCICFVIDEYWSLETTNFWFF